MMRLPVANGRAYIAGDVIVFAAARVTYSTRLADRKTSRSPMRRGWILPRTIYFIPLRCLQNNPYLYREKMSRVCL